MLKENTLKVGGNNQEITLVDENLLPYACFISNYDKYVNRSVAWHWHPTFELGYVDSGAVHIRTPDGEGIAKKGDGIFINTSIMHKFESLERKEGTVNLVQQFSVEFLTGFGGNIIEKKYLTPITQCEELEFLIIHPDNRRRIKLLDCMQDLIELNRTEAWGYELKVRALLSEFWLLLLEETEEVRKNSVPHYSADADRIKRMMSFIQENYSEQVTVADIAAAADISMRECSRCFRRCSGLAPIEYLNRFRLRTAAQMLLRTDRSVLEISEACGFRSGSYFAKAFQEAMGCTPRNYRVRNENSKNTEKPEETENV